MEPKHFFTFFILQKMKMKIAVQKETLEICLASIWLCLSHLERKLATISIIEPINLSFDAYSLPEKIHFLICTSWIAYCFHHKDMILLLLGIMTQLVNDLSLYLRLLSILPPALLASNKLTSRSLQNNDRSHLLP